MPRKCMNCKSRKDMVRFENETFTIDHAGASAKVEGLSGWRYEACGDVEFDAESARRYAATGDDLVLQERARQSQEIRRIRRKLKLTQVAAARLTGGGHNAFSRYERGEVTPMPAVFNLFRLLDKHPKSLHDLVKDAEAAQFFESAPIGRKERRAFQKASRKTWTRE
jgi:HTH-type transcriptional regulator/antitoxin MqsA